MPNNYKAATDAVPDSSNATVAASRGKDALTAADTSAPKTRASDKAPATGNAPNNLQRNLDSSMERARAPQDDIGPGVREPA